MATAPRVEAFHVGDRVRDRLGSADNSGVVVSKLTSGAVVVQWSDGMIRTVLHADASARFELLERSEASKVRKSTAVEDARAAAGLLRSMGYPKYAVAIDELLVQAAVEGARSDG